MQKHIDQRLSDDSFAVDFNALPTAIRLGAKLSNHSTIDAHPPSQNEFFCFTPRGNAGASKDFLQSLCHNRT